MTQMALDGTPAKESWEVKITDKEVTETRGSDGGGRVKTKHTDTMDHFYRFQASDVYEVVPMAMNEYREHQESDARVITKITPKWLGSGA